MSEAPINVLVAGHTVNLGSSDDADPAVRIFLKKESATAYVDYTDPTLTLTDAGGARTVTVTSGMTMAAFIALIDATEYWTAEPVGSRWDHAIDSSGTQLMINSTTYTATNIPDTGVELFWDTSAIKERRGCLGMQTVRTDYSGNSTPARAMIQWANLGLHVDPTLNNTTANTERGSFRPDFVANLRTAYGVGTHAAGASQWKVSFRGRDYDRPQMVFAGEATTVASKLNGTNQLPPEGLCSGPGEAIVITYGEATAITSSTVTFSGDIGTCN